MGDATGYFKISNGPSGAASAHAGYISRKQAVGGLDGIATINCPAELQNATSYRDFRLAFQAHMRAEQRAEIASHGNRRGSARTDYRFQFAVPQNLPKRESLEEVRGFMAEHFPEAKTVLAGHDDTDVYHIHGQSAARQKDGKKIHVSKSDFRTLTRAWGDLNAELHARADAREHGLSPQQQEQIRYALATRHREKLADTARYKKAAARHFEKIETGSAAEQIMAKAQGPPEKPERAEDRRQGAVPFSNRSRQQRRYDQQDRQVKGPRQEELNRLFQTRMRRQYDPAPPVITAEPRTPAEIMHDLISGGRPAPIPPTLDQISYALDAANEISVFSRNDPQLPDREPAHHADAISAALDADSISHALEKASPENGPQQKPQPDTARRSRASQRESHAATL